MTRALFFTIFVLILMLMNYYVYARFLGRLEILQGHIFWIRIFCVLLALLCLSFALSGFGAGLPVWLYFICASALGLSFFLFSLAILYEIFRAVFGDIKLAGLCFLLLGFGLAFYSFASALLPPKIKYQEVSLLNLKAPLRIAMVSDVHIGEFLKGDFLSLIVQKINAQNPDIVVIVGDLIDLPAHKIGNMLDTLKSLKSKYGTFFVPGNHEYYHGVSQIMNALSELGVQVLANKSQDVAGINLVGLLDLAGVGTPLAPDVKIALNKIDSKKPTILLAHQPKATGLLSADFSGLVLSGHTHGGQIFPFSLLVKLDQPYLHGLYEFSKNGQIYVSSGAGFWGPPMRLFAPSEIVILDIKEKK